MAMFCTNSLKAALVAVIITFALGGCSDTLAPNGPNLELDSNQSVDGTKFRNEKFVRRAMRKRLGKSGSEDYLGLIVNVESGVSSQKVLERLKVLERFKVLERGSYLEVFNGFAIEVTDNRSRVDFTELFQSLLDDPDVIWFEPDLTIQMPKSDRSNANGGQRIPWSVAMVGGTQSWALSGDGSGSVDMDVYVLDTGVLSSDLNIAEHMVFSEDPLDEETLDGHGTHIAGIIGAIDNSHGIVGIAPGVRIHDFKVLNDDGTAPTSVVLDAMEELIRRKSARPELPMVVNMSLGENVGAEETSLDVAVTSAVDRGIVVVASAGNWGTSVANVTPARAPGVITVGSHGMTGIFSVFSNFGSEVDILAPGESVVSLKGASSSVVEMSGTSIAASHVSGAAALYLAKNPTATPAQVSAFLKGQAKDIVLGVPAQTTKASVWVGPATNLASQSQLVVQSAAKRLLFIVDSPEAMSRQDNLKRDAFESWGFDVTVVPASLGKGRLIAKSGNADVVFVSGSINPNHLRGKISDVATGIVSEESGLANHLGLAASGVDASKKIAALHVGRIAHPIVDGYRGKVEITEKQEVAYYTGIGRDVDVLGSWSGRSSLLALDVGKQRTDGLSAPARRVMLPLGTPSFEYTQLKNPGFEIWKRSVQWAAGIEVSQASQGSNSSSRSH